jgi:hypothetical protein
MRSWEVQTDFRCLIWSCLGALGVLASWHLGGSISSHSDRDSQSTIPNIGTLWSLPGFDGLKSGWFGCAGDGVSARDANEATPLPKERAKFPNPAEPEPKGIPYPGSRIEWPVGESTTETLSPTGFTEDGQGAQRPLLALNFSALSGALCFSGFLGLLRKNRRKPVHFWWVRYAKGHWKFEIGRLGF